MQTFTDLVREPKDAASFTERQRRAQLTAATIDLIAESGIEAASFAAIAGRTGASKGTIAYHFGSREELLLAVTRSIYRDAADAMSPVRQEACAADALRSYVATNIAWIAARRQATVALIILRTSGVSAVRTLCAAVDEAILADLSALIEAARAETGVPPAGTDDLARALRGAIDAFAIGLARRSAHLDADAYTAVLHHLFAPTAAASR
ncbi:HTH-type transcriptional regulator betI [Actinoplanes sp. SE50]|uniref:TetR/AcrR family transcriptional regulator n=1 Tax=unclassified Actinoplanes TaxID=2626549 RepID=UPI00023ED513|nr:MULTISPECIES: TetR/AcrR family transcriptional regulator [unclassified Actinoplanes]AEV87890.1 HTH-type transcriptional regulator betI [Actinoplanes sp. SE50/110]ATO86294.1 HTH-type transcriptional regulator betI [Actinoplanes sp. SE50]SLM03709.1 TetR family transcriptional regulator [Actinoplanes sp. SE50/110]